MCSQAVKLTKQKGHFPEQQEHFGAFPGSWKAGQAEHRLCRVLSCAKLGHAALGAWASTESGVQLSELCPPIGFIFSLEMPENALIGSGRPLAEDSQAESLAL